jgi:hypothetical protein
MSIERTIKLEEANKRAIEDYSQFSQYARTAAQFAFGANGGAAAAILSFLTTTVNSSAQNSFDRGIIVRDFAIASAFYLTGLLISIGSMYLFARSKKLWGDAWENTALTGIVNFNSPFARAAQRLENRAWGTFALSGVALAVGSFFAVIGFFQQH